ncbi:pyridoxamine 5'-phosphate oxidase family protein [Amycolatopsis mongoliensis]|uniref:Pyridoxamine 5'-phosphate oxidase family protein n=1 Tax=Amycolatopsis mongoliensis TaxID=715475 RepID=A0A9Y2JQ72_9PSEU|nr:pyridoxamine 5'-phosphate oxidase family protein [Amycolatopsis sp. 4-36]WIY00979.1 pyridoxamine 5'-phosphate oxidase family protein [Amycolatopsis sp. 4-36]
MTTSSSRSLIHRSEDLIEHARFMTLATCGPDGPWASTVNYVPMRQPMRLLWYSLRNAQHSRNIEAAPVVSGSVFRIGVPNPLGLDGAQFTGTARAVDAGELEELAEFYYRRNFSDEQTRQKWRLPLAEFQADGPRRFYLVTVTAWWLFDLEGWLVDMNDRRVAVDLAALSAGGRKVHT